MACEAEGFDFRGLRSTFAVVPKVHLAGRDLDHQLRCSGHSFIIAEVVAHPGRRSNAACGSRPVRMRHAVSASPRQTTCAGSSRETPISFSIRVSRA